MKLTLWGAASESTQFGKSFDILDKMKPGETWKYSIMYTSLDPDQVNHAGVNVTYEWSE